MFHDSDCCLEADRGAGDRRLVQHRRLVRDYEKIECGTAGWIVIALTRIILARLA